MAKEYYRKRQNEYLELRHSEDPILRDFWWENRKRRHKNYSKSARSKTAEALLAGDEVNVHFVKDRGTNHVAQLVVIGGQTLRINHSVVKLDQTQKLYVQCVITDEPDGHCYARDSRPSDDASRLVMKIGGTNSEGETFDAIPFARGKKYCFTIKLCL
jgi:hypothetical protein